MDLKIMIRNAKHRWSAATSLTLSGSVILEAEKDKKIILPTIKKTMVKMVNFEDIR